MQFQIDKLSNANYSNSKISSIFSLYLFSFGTGLLGFSVYLFLESIGSINKSILSKIFSNQNKRERTLKSRFNRNQSVCYF